MSIVQVSQCLVEQPAMMAWEVEICMYFNLCTTWRWVVSVTLQPLYSPGGEGSESFQYAVCGNKM
jgi:hypothetical protein